MLQEKDGAKLQIFLGVYIGAKTGRSSNKNVAQSIVLELILRAWTKRYEMNTDVTSKDEAKLQTFLGVYIWAKTGRSPNRNIAQSNALVKMHKQTGAL